MARLPILLAALPILCLADAGTLIPSGRETPDPAVLSLDELAIDITIDRGSAKILTRQIFGSHSRKPSKALTPSPSPPAPSSATSPSGTKPSASPV